MTHKIDKTFPVKLGDIIDTTGLPFDTTLAAYENRLRKAFLKMFGMKSMKADYWKVLKEMISDPNETFGLVEIDGYLADMTGSDDIALVFNMGIPRLRGRTVYYLDRIYARVCGNGELRFYNSTLEDDNTYWNNNYRAPAWHPHIQNSTPCLGSYGTELARWKSENNPIMYLKTIHMFLNTWNRRSPFFDVNRAKINWDIDGTIFKDSKVGNALHASGISRTTSAENFIVNNINKIKTGSIQNDAYILAEILGKLNFVKELLGNDIVNKLDNSDYHFIRNISDDNLERRNQNRGRNNRSFSIINNETTRIMIPTYHDERTSVNSVTIATGKITNDPKYLTSKKILIGLEYLMEKLFNHLTKGGIYDRIYEECDYAIYLYCRYIVPLILKENEVFDEMTNSGKYNVRIHRESNEPTSIAPTFSVKKKNVMSFTNKRKRRITRMMSKRYSDMFTVKFINLVIKEELEKAFYYEMESQDSRYEGQEFSYLKEKGAFWQNMGIYQADHLFEDILTILDHNKPETLNELIEMYEGIKKNVIQEESKQLIVEYTKIIRSLQNYGNETNHTKEDTQQVHLSFE